jgi:peptidoglycan/xylan/chitin deacetylase (PgdA/CDA1 family)
MALPEFYSSLAPFEEAFLAGQPILTYHHVGSRPRGARIKGLYVSPKLFARQMAELKAAGFSTPPLAQVTVGGANALCHAFLTFDDGFRDVFEHGLPALQAHGFRAVLFLVADLIGRSNEWQQRTGDVVEPLMDEAQVRDWLAAGHEIGSHTLTHPRLTELPPAEAREQIVASKKKLEDLFDVAIDHFCYPYGDWNTPVHDLVSEASYRTACTTDFGINDTASRPLALKRLTARYPSFRRGHLRWWLLSAWRSLRLAAPRRSRLPESGARNRFSSKKP